MDYEKIHKLKRTWIKTSLTIALILPILAILVIKDWSLYSDALSSFGTHPKTAGIWPIYLAVMSIGLWLNGSNKIEEYYTGIRAHGLSYLLSASCTGLILTALITEEFRLAHGIVAGVFFLCYLIFLFLFGVLLIKSDLRLGSFSVIVSLILLLTGLLTIPVKGLALFELGYISIVLYWNWAILNKAHIEKAIRFVEKIIGTNTSKALED